MIAQISNQIIFDSVKLNDDPKHLEFFQSRDRVIDFYGGGGSGKSYDVVDKIIMEIIQLNWRKVLVIRKTLPALKKSCIPIFRQRLEDHGVPYEENKTEHTIRIGIGLVIFTSMNNKSDYENIKSITDVDGIWFEECNQLDLEAYELAKMRLRGGKGVYKQVIRTYNPVMSWIYDYAFVHNYEKSKKILVNVENNKFAEDEYKADLRALKERNKSKYDVYYLGQWGQIEGIIYDNWDIIPELPKHNFKEYGGLDFGFSHPASLIQCYQYEDDIYLEEKIYKPGLTNQKLHDEAVSNGYKFDSQITTADSAEPKSIEELFNRNWMIYPAIKGQDSVWFGIQYCQEKNLHIIDGSINLIKEISGYCRMQDKNGKFIDEPVKSNDHAMDAMRYAVTGFEFHNHGALNIGEVNL